MSEYTIAWEDRNQRELMSFVASDTGGKLVAYYRNTMQYLLRQAMDEEEPSIALHKLYTAKGFQLALAIIDFPVERQSPQTEEYAEEEHKANAIFAKIVSRPATFK